MFMIMLKYNFQYFILLSFCSIYTYSFVIHTINIRNIRICTSFTPSKTWPTHYQVHYIITHWFMIVTIIVFLLLLLITQCVGKRGKTFHETLFWISMYNTNITPKRHFFLEYYLANYTESHTDIVQSKSWGQVYLHVLTESII